MGDTLELSLVTAVIFAALLWRRAVARRKGLPINHPSIQRSYFLLMAGIVGTLLAIGFIVSLVTAPNRPPLH